MGGLGSGVPAGLRYHALKLSKDTCSRTQLPTSRRDTSQDKVNVQLSLSLFPCLLFPSQFPSALSNWKKYKEWKVNALKMRSRNFKWERGKRKKSDTILYMGSWCLKPETQYILNKTRNYIFSITLLYLITIFLNSLQKDTEIAILYRVTYSHILIYNCNPQVRDCNNLFSSLTWM